MPDESEITIRVMGDTTGLSTTMASGGAALNALGHHAEVADPKLDHLAHTIDRMAGHMVAHAAGLGGYGRLLEHLGVQAMGAVPFLIALIPAAAIAGGVIAWEKYEEHIRKVKEITDEVTIYFSKQEDKLNDLDAEYIGLTQGSLAKFSKEMENLRDKTLELKSGIEVINKLLEEQDGGFTRTVTSMYAYIEGSRILAALTPGATYRSQQITYNAKDAEAFTTGIKEQVDAAKDKLTALDMAKIASGGELVKINQIEKGQAGEVLAETEKARKNVQAFYEEMKKQREELQKSLDIKGLKGAKEQGAEVIKGMEEAATMEKAYLEVQEKGREQTVKNMEADKKLADIRMEIAKPVTLGAASEASLMAERDWATQKVRADETADMEINAAKRKDAILKEGDLEAETYDKREVERQKAAILVGEEKTMALKKAEDDYDAAVARGRQDLANTLQDIDNAEALSNEVALKDRKAADDSYAKGVEALEKKLETDILAIKEKEMAQEARRVDVMLREQERFTKLPKMMGPFVSEPTGMMAKEAEDAGVAAEEYGRLAEKMHELVLVQQERADMAALNYKEGSAEALDEERHLMELQSGEDNYAAKAKEDADRRRALLAQIDIQFKMSVKDMTATFNQGVESWISGSQRFGKAMEQSLASILKRFIMNQVQMAEAAVFGNEKITAAKEREHIKQTFIDAKGAFTATMKNYPFPVNIPLAIASFAETMAMAERGGVMEEDSALFAHAKEMVLPAKLSTFIQHAAEGASRTPGEGGREGPAGEPGVGGGMHFHYAPQIHAIDHIGVADLLKQHSVTIAGIVHKEMRRVNYV